MVAFAAETTSCICGKSHDTWECFGFRYAFFHAEKNDPLVKEILDHYLSVCAAGIITIIHAFVPEQVVLRGGLMKKVKVVEVRFPDLAALYSADHLVRTNINFK